MTSAYGNSYHYSDHVTEGHYAFQAVEAGDYMACFFASDHKPAVTLTVDFDWKSGVAAKDWTSVAKKGSVEVSCSMCHMLSFWYATFDDRWRVFLQSVVLVYTFGSCKVVCLSL